MNTRRPINPLRTLAFHAVFQIGTVLHVSAALMSAVLRPAWIGPVARSWSRFHRQCVEHILAIEVRETGPRPAGQALYAVRHESFFEAIDLPWLLLHPVPFAKQELFDIPGWGRAARAYGVVPVARQDGARALRTLIRDARAFAATGRPLVIFPEGTRIRHGTVAPLQAGFAALYKALALPVVPVAVDSGLTYPGFRKRRGTITYRFGEAIAPGLPRAEIEALVHEAINALNTPADQAPVP